MICTVGANSEITLNNIEGTISGGVQQQQKGNKLKQPLFIAVIGIVFLLVLLSFALTHNKDVVSELQQKQLLLQQYRIDGSLSYNNYYLAHEIHSAQATDPQANINDIVLNYNNAYYSLLAEYGNKGIDTSINHLLACYRELEALLQNDEVSQDLKQQKSNECNNAIAVLDENIFSVMKERYS